MNLSETGEPNQPEEPDPPDKPNQPEEPDQPDKPNQPDAEQKGGATNHELLPAKQTVAADRKNNLSKFRI